MPAKHLERGSLREIGVQALVDLLGMDPQERGYDAIMRFVESRVGDSPQGYPPDLPRIVFDPDAGLYAYHRSRWEKVDDWDVFDALTAYDTVGYGVSTNKKQVNLSKTLVMSASWLAQVAVRRSKYFAEALPGFAFSDLAVCVYDEKYQLATLDPGLRISSGVDSPMPQILKDDGCCDLPPFGPEWLATAPPLKYIRDVIGDDPDDARALQEVVGLGLIGVANRASKGLALLGPPGGGKGTVADILRHVFPPESVYEGPPVSTIKVDYGRVVIVGKRLHVHNDVDDMGSVKEINRVISGEGINCRWLQGHPFTYYPSCATLMTLNEMPTVKGKETGGLFRRWVIIPCERSLHESGTTRQDIIKECAAFRPQLAAWLIAGAARFMMSKKVSTSAASKDEIERWRNDSMPWLEWLVFNLFVDPALPTTHHTRALALKDIQAKWASEVVTEPGGSSLAASMTPQRFAAAVSEVFKDVAGKKTNSGRVYFNLRWRSKGEEIAAKTWGGGGLVTG